MDHETSARLVACLLSREAMCWSPEVTLAFLGVELACCGLLWRRGERAFVAGMSPLVLQEAVQWLLWLEIGDDEIRRQSGTCSVSNSRLTAVEFVLVGWMVPCGFILMSAHSVRQWMESVSDAAAGVLGKGAMSSPPALDATLGEHGKGEHARLMSEVEGARASGARRTEMLAYFRARLSKELSMARLALWLVSAFALSLGAYIGWGVQSGWWGPLCTVRGTRGGHQLWPWVAPPLPPALVAELRRAEQSSEQEAASLPTWPAGLHLPSASRAAHVLWYSALALTYLCCVSCVALYKGEVRPIGLGADFDGNFRRGRLPQFAIMTFGASRRGPVEVGLVGVGAGRRRAEGLGDRPAGDGLRPRTGWRGAHRGALGQRAVCVTR